MLNRAAVTVTPKEPYLEWVRRTCPEVTTPETYWDRTVVTGQ